jgi:L-ascorbate metabolism protein UlaG (beta-lactamase superfamily)
MKRLAREYSPAIYTTLGVGKYLEKKGISNVTELDWWDETNMAPGLKLICTPAQHFSGRGTFDRDRTLWCGFAIMTVKGSIYYSGDTGFGEFFNEIAKRIGPVRLAFLPIGAYKPAWFMSPIHTSPSDAVEIHKIINSPGSIGMHFGTFPLADDSMEDPVNDLRLALEKEGISDTVFIAPKEGIRLVYTSDN